jgi:hypothetical protein
MPESSCRLALQINATRWWYALGMDIKFVCELVAALGSVGVPLFVALFLPFFVSKSTQQEPYLKRVAKKYSIPPLDLR